MRVLDFNGLYGQDAHEYYRYSKACLNWIYTFQSPGDYFWPVWYPTIGAVFAFVFHASVLTVLQLFSIFWVAYSMLIVVRWYRSDTDMLTPLIYALLALGFSPLLLRAGLVAMPDTMSMAITLLAFYCFKWYKETGKTVAVYLFALAVTVAVMTRYAAAIVLMPPSLMFAYFLLHGKQWKQILICIAIAMVVCFPHFAIRYQAPLAFVQHEWLTSWSLSNFIVRDFVTPDGTQHYKVPNIIYALGGFLHPGFGVLILPLLIFVRKQDFAATVNKVLVASIILYSLFLAGIPFQNKRFLLATLPLIVVMLYPAYQRLLAFVKIKWLAIAGVAVVQIVLCWFMFNEFYQRNRLEKQLAKVVVSQPEKVLYSFDIDIAIKSYDTTKIMRNLWLHQYDTFETGSLVLFNEKALAKQWQGKNPMLNWQHLKASYTLVPVSSVDNGWELFRIEGRKEQ